VAHAREVKMADRPAVHQHAASVPAAWIDEYRSLRPALLGHVMDDGFVDEKVRSWVSGGLVVGTALTVRLPDGDLECIVPAVDMLQPGDVLVIDHGGRESLACWGELTALAAKMRGCVGVVVDGAVANIAELRELGLPTFARGVAALGGRRLGVDGGVNVPIQCGGVAVHPGDLVVANDDGVVVIPPPRLADVATPARAALERLPLARTWLQHGGSLAEISLLEAPEVAALLQQRGWSA
jgi:4-hydroxy-4-methyl-2-oxoglutarate aldolase